MAQVSRATSKTKFETGDIPTQADFIDLHDSVTWYDEGGGGVSDGDKGDIVVSGSGATWKLESEIKKISAAKALASLGQEIHASPIWDVSRLSSTNNLTSGILYMIPVVLLYDQTITGVRWYQSTQGSYTASNYNGLGLYTFSADTYTRVALTTDDGDIWKATSGWKSKDFSATYAATAGVYHIGILYNTSSQITAPAIATGGSMVSGLSIITTTPTTKRLLWQATGISSMPSTTSADSHLSTMYYVALY